MGRFLGSTGGGSEGVILREEKGCWYFRKQSGRRGVVYSISDIGKTCK